MSVGLSRLYFGISTTRWGAANSGYNNKRETGLQDDIEQWPYL